MSSIKDAEIELSLITGLSPLNPRQDMTSDVSELAAWILACGLLEPILVIPASSGDDYHVLAGGRRWRALRSLGDEDRVVEVRIFSGSEAEAREAALAENVTQRPLHPVQEFEAFSKLEMAGLDVPTIAHHSGLSEKHVRQRLALGRLSPRVREMWREGKIGREIAQAFTAGTIEAQDALLDDYGKRGLGPPASPYTVKRSLQREAVEAHHALAKFILADRERRMAYEAEGGRIEEDLFSDETTLLDRVVAQRIADRLLLAEAERVAEAEGWGSAAVATGDEEPDPTIEPDYTKKELQRRDASDATPQELDEIETRALLRAVPKKRRATLGVYVGLLHDGSTEIIRGVPPAEPEPEEEPAREAGEMRAAAKKGERAAATPREQEEGPAIPPPTGGKDAEEILAHALGDGLASATARSVNLALALAVATLGCSHGQFGVTLDCSTVDSAEPRSELVGRIAHMRFETALAIVATAPLADLTAAFAELVGRAIDPGEITPRRAQNLVTLAERHADLRADICAALDYKGFFAASPREEALDAIRALDGEAAAVDAGKLRKPKIVERAALLAKNRQWLPKTLTALLAAGSKDERSTAQAMVEAIERDEERSAEDALARAEDRPEDEIAAETDGEGMPGDAAGAADDAAVTATSSNEEADADLDEWGEDLARVGATSNHSHFADFLRAHATPAPGRHVGVDALDARFEAYRAARSLKKVSKGSQAAMLTELGFTKKKIDGALSWQGLALHADAEAQLAAE
jgi:ParB family chromosome partitioning protein